MRVRAYGVLSHAKFHRDRRILLYITTHNYANMTDFGLLGSCTHTLWPIGAKAGLQEYSHAVCLYVKFYRIFNFNIL